MNDSGEKTLFAVEDYTETLITSPIDADLEGDEDPNYITLKKHDHHWRPWVMHDDRMSFVCDCGETTFKPSKSEVARLWVEHSQTLAATAEVFTKAQTKQVVYFDWQRFDNSYAVLKALVQILPDFLAPPKTFDNRQLPVIEEVAEPEKTSGLNRYKCKGSRNHYWRYTYKHNGRTKHLHIKGGNERAPLVKRRVASIQKMIDDGADHWAIAKLIKSWS